MALNITGKVGWWSGSVNAAGGCGYADTDVCNFITAANITDTTQKSAINTLVTQLKTYGIWTKMKALYPFVGGTASSHKFNLKDPRDLDAAFRLTFSGGWTHSSTGALPNGTNGYANTFFSPSANQSLTSANFSLYSRTSGKSLSTYGGQGCYNSSSNCSYMIIRRNIDDYIGGLMWSETGGGGAFIIASTPDGRGHYMTSRTSNNSLHFYKNGTSIVSNTLTQSSTSLPTNTYYLGANNGTLGGDYDNKELAFASLGDGLTTTEAANFYTAVQTFQTTLGRQVGVPIVADTDAQAFLNAAVITDSTQANAINTLVTDLKSANIWTKMKAIYPFVGGTATTHKFNLKDPRDLDAAYRLVFNGGWTHSATGALPNGSNAYADTKLVPSSNLSLNSTHISYYSRTNTLANTYKSEIGVTSSATYIPLLHLRIKGLEAGFSDQAVSQIWSYETNQGIRVGVSYNSTGLFVSSRNSATSFKLTRNNSLVGQVTTSNNQTTMPNARVYLGALNDSNTATYYYTDRESAFASIGDGLTDAEATAFYNAVQAYQTTLGRQV